MSERARLNAGNPLEQAGLPALRFLYACLAWCPVLSQVSDVSVPEVSLPPKRRKVCKCDLCGHLSSEKKWSRTKKVGVRQEVCPEGKRCFDCFLSVAAFVASDRETLPKTLQDCGCDGVESVWSRVGKDWLASPFSRPQTGLRYYCKKKLKLLLIPLLK